MRVGEPLKFNYIIRGYFKSEKWESKLYKTETGMNKVFHKLLLDPDYTELKRFAVMDIGKIFGEIIYKDNNNKKMESDKNGISITGNS
jgi:hypothetical protein